MAVASNRQRGTLKPATHAAAAAAAATTGTITNIGATSRAVSIIAAAHRTHHHAKAKNCPSQILSSMQSLLSIHQHSLHCQLHSKSLHLLVAHVAKIVQELHSLTTTQSS